MDTAKAKATWTTAGLNERGLAAVNMWVDTLAAHIADGKGKFDAYAKFAYYAGNDPMGCLQMLKQAVDQTN